MRKEKFDDYIDRFNRRDPTAFEDHVHPNAKIINGRLEIHGMPCFIRTHVLPREKCLKSTTPTSGAGPP